MSSNISTNRFLIVDGSNYLFRSYFGVPESASFKGVKVNAVYGFFAILRRMTLATSPDAIIVVFDSETGILNKVESHPEYKSTRTYVDTGMYVQLPMIKSILEQCQIQWVEPQEHEADDVIGVYATEIARSGGFSYISSNDFDFAQLITEKITLVRDIKGKAIQINAAQFKKEWAITPIQYLDYLALKGDTSDNVAGIMGIGHKTALDLVCKYQSIQGIVDHLDSINPRISNKIKSEKERIFANLNFLRIATDTNIQLNPIMIEGRNATFRDALFNKTTNELLMEPAFVNKI